MATFFVTNSHIAHSKNAIPAECSLNRVISFKKNLSSFNVKLGVAWPISLNGKPVWITPYHVISDAAKIIILDCQDRLHTVKIERSNLRSDIALLTGSDTITRERGKNIINVNTNNPDAPLENNWKDKNTFHFPYSGTSWSNISIHPDSLFYAQASQELGKEYNENLLIYSSLASFPTASGSLIYSSGNKMGMLLRTEYFASKSLFLPLEEIVSFLTEKITDTHFSFLSENSILLGENEEHRTILSDPCLSSSHVSQWSDTGGGTWGNGGGGTWGNGGGGTWGNGGGATLSAEVQFKIRNELLDPKENKPISHELKLYLDFITQEFTQHAYLSNTSIGYYFSLPMCKERALVWQKWDKKDAKKVVSKKLPFLQIGDKTIPLSLDLLSKHDLDTLSNIDVSAAVTPITLSQNKQIPLFSSEDESNDFLLRSYCSFSNQKYFSKAQTSFTPVSSLSYIMGIGFLNTFSYELHLYNETNQDKADASIECGNQYVEISTYLDDSMSVSLKIYSDKIGILKITDRSSPLSAEFSIQALNTWAQSELNLTSTTKSRPATTSLYYELGLSRGLDNDSSYFELYLNNLKLGNQHAKPLKIILK